VLEILTQCPAEEMIAHPVSSLVNNVKNDGPELNGASEELGIAQSLYIARRGTLRCYRKVPLGNQHGVHRPNERKFGKHLSWLRRAKVDRAHLTLTRRIQVRRAAIRQILCHATMKLTKQELAGIAELTIRHYNQRAEAYWQGTRDHDVSQNIAALLQHIAASAPFAILDLGCGPGRDLMAFAKLGHIAAGLEGATALAGERLAPRVKGRTAPSSTRRGITSRAHEITPREQEKGPRRRIDD
jgi:hypothetical protein